MESRKNESMSTAYERMKRRKRSNSALHLVIGAFAFSGLILGGIVFFVYSNMPEKSELQKPERATIRIIKIPKPGLNHENYARVKAGMTYSEVEKILGPPTNRTQLEVETKRLHQITLQWQSEELGICSITFQNGRVASKVRMDFGF